MTTTNDSQEKLDSKRASKRVPGKWRSWETTEGAIRAPHRSMMKAMGLSDKDIQAPFVGIASTHNEVTPCNSGIAPLVEEVKRGVFAAEGTPFTFGTITVSDAISMGTEGMRGSLVSREVIADSIETVVFAERYDGRVVVAGCDKSLRGGMMSMARLNVASVFIYGGSILPGSLHGEDIQIQNVFEAVGQYQTGEIDANELLDIENHACPGSGSCGGMFTANTMSSIGEALGLSLPGSASEPNVDQRKAASSREAGHAVLNLLRKNIRPSDILTRKAFENGYHYEYTRMLPIAAERVYVCSKGSDYSREGEFLVLRQEDGHWTASDSSRANDGALVSHQPVFRSDEDITTPGWHTWQTNYNASAGAPHPTPGTIQHTTYTMHHTLYTIHHTPQHQRLRRQRSRHRHQRHRRLRHQRLRHPRRQHQRLRCQSLRH